MKFFLITAALVAVAVAGPVLVQPGGMGPAPVEDLDSPFYAGPAFVDQPQHPVPIIQIVVNVNSQGQVEVSPIDIAPEVVQIPEIQDPSPIEIPAPVFPSPQPAPIIVPEAVLPAPQPSPVIQEADSLN